MVAELLKRVDFVFYFHTISDWRISKVMCQDIEMNGPQRTACLAKGYRSN